MSSESFLTNSSPPSFSAATYAAVPIKKRPFLNSQSLDEAVYCKEPKLSRNSSVSGCTDFNIDSILSTKYVPKTPTESLLLPTINDISLPGNASMPSGRNTDQSNDRAFPSVESQSSKSMQEKDKSNLSISKADATSSEDTFLPSSEDTLPALSKPPLPSLKNAVSATTSSLLALCKACFGDSQQNVSQASNTNIALPNSLSSGSDDISKIALQSQLAIELSNNPSFMQENNHANQLSTNPQTTCTSDSDSLLDHGLSKKVENNIKVESPTKSVKPIACIDLTLDDDEPEPFPVPKTQLSKRVSKSAVIDLTFSNSPESLKMPAEEEQSLFLTKQLQASQIVAEFVLRYFLTITYHTLTMPKNLKVKKTFLGFEITGPQEDVLKAENILNSVKWYGEEISYSCPKLANHFASDAWKDFKKVLESENRCAVEVQFQKDVSSSKSSQDSQTQASSSQGSSKVSLTELQPSISMDRGLLANLLEDDLPVIPPKVLPVTSPVPPPRVDIPLLLDKSAKFVNYGPLKVVVCQGDITDEFTDAIVNGVMQNFDFSGVISQRIIQKGGNEIPQECVFRCNGDFGPFVRVTGGYALNCKHVIHVITPTSIDEYPQRILMALNAANQLGLQSIAIPTIGTGRVQLNPTLVSQRMATAFEQFAVTVHNRPNNLKTIKVVIYEAPLLQTFSSNIISLKEIQSFGNNRVLSLEEKIKSMSMTDYIVICVKSDRSSNAQQAKERILSHMKQHISERLIDNNIVLKLGDHDCIDIYEASIKHHVKVEYKQGDNQTTGIVLFGINDHVTQLHDYIRELWFELREAETMARMNAWKWEIAPMNFADMPCRVSREIEKCYEQNNQGIHDVRLFGETMNINFATMTYSFLSTGGRVLRGGSLNADSSFPPEWIEMSDRTLMRIPLPTTSPEYQTVCSKFFRSNPNVKRIVRIERIQNVALYRQYQVMKNHVAKKLTSTNPVMRELFHGTSEADANSICSHGFNRSFVGKNGTAYGKGCYFAVDSSYSVGYAKRGRGTKYGFIFLSLVLTGDYTQGSPDMRSPPEKYSNGEEKLLYDSVVDNMNNPQMFVVFKDSSVYPSYLVVFS